MSNTYKITIYDELFGELSGEFTAKTEQQAITECREEYAYELDTDVESIEIIKVELL